MRTQTTDNQQWPYDDVTDTNVYVQLPRGRGRHPDAPRHHRNTPSYVISNVKMTFTCEACNRTFDTRRQHDKHRNWITLDNNIGAFIVIQTSAPGRTESRTPSPCTPTHRRNRTRRESTPQVIFGHRWNATKSMSNQDSNPGQSKSKHLRKVHSPGNNSTGIPR